MIRDVPLMTLIQPIVMHHHLGFGPSWMTTFSDDLLEGHNQTVTYKGISCSVVSFTWYGYQLYTSHETKTMFRYFQNDKTFVLK